jgi:hypothetical protein
MSVKKKVRDFLEAVDDKLNKSIDKTLDVRTIKDVESSQIDLWELKAKLFRKIFGKKDVVFVQEQISSLMTAAFQQGRMAERKSLAEQIIFK